ncbi:MAG: hypothetical protein HYX60_07830 [Legionella longbeachae]|nr:hypothetical protein [Legionella longbeachae]
MMEKQKFENSFDDVKNLLNKLEPELKNFKLLVASMSEVISPYKNQFNFVRTLCKREHYHKNIEEHVKLIVSEFDTIADLLEKVSNDENVKELYDKNSILEKCLEIRDNILKKIS